MHIQEPGSGNFPPSFPAFFVFDLNINAVVYFLWVAYSLGQYSMDVKGLCLVGGGSIFGGECSNSDLGQDGWILGSNCTLLGGAGFVGWFVLLFLS